MNKSNTKKTEVFSSVMEWTNEALKQQQRREELLLKDLSQNSCVIENNVQLKFTCTGASEQLCQTSGKRKYSKSLSSYIFDKDF